jgi:hypothetical protein
MLGSSLSIYLSASLPLTLCVCACTLCVHPVRAPCACTLCVLQCSLEAALAIAAKPSALVIEPITAKGPATSPRAPGTQASPSQPSMRRRPPPLTATQFSSELERKFFADRERDLPIVKEIYWRAIELFMASVVNMDCRNLGWGDRDVFSLCDVLRDTRPTALQLIDLEGNHGVGSAGISALADVLQRAVAPRLKRVWFGTGSPRDESGAYSSLPFAEARRGWLGVGGAPRLKGINALAKHTAWNATDESAVRVEGGRF